VVFKRFYELPVGNSEIILCRVIISKRAGIFVLLHLRSQARHPSQILANASSKLILDIQNYISIPDFITRNTPTTKEPATGQCAIHGRQHSRLYCTSKFQYEISIS
jgi:hypothetical protein